jgi:hypothetical protein
MREALTEAQCHIGRVAAVEGALERRAPGNKGD